MPRLVHAQSTSTVEGDHRERDFTSGRRRGKQVIQVHAVDAAGKVAVNRALARGKFIEWCVHLSAGCLVAMEASSGAHHWCRKLVALGLNVRIMPAQMVSPYRLQGKGGKNDANDAAAICEAASRPQMHFVMPKTIAQQGMLCVHRVREGFKEERTATINRIRGLLGEFGVVLPQSSAVLRERLTEVLEDASNDIAGRANCHASGAPRMMKDTWGCERAG